jgi:hypothetical protein
VGGGEGAGANGVLKSRPAARSRIFLLFLSSCDSERELLGVPIMPSKNTVTVYHEDGVCTYRIKEANFCIEDFALHAIITTFENETCALAFAGDPILYVVGAIVESESNEDLEEVEIFAESGRDAEDVDTIFRIYISDHFTLDNNHLRLKRIGENLVNVEWACDADDFNSGFPKRNKLEVFCEGKLLSPNDFTEFSRKF